MKNKNTIKPINPHFNKNEAPATLEEKIAQAKLLDKATKRAARKRRSIKYGFLSKIFKIHGN